MSLSSKKIVRSLITYYFQALIFAATTYGLFVIIWGPIQLTFSAWLIGTLAGFTVGYIPILKGHFKDHRQQS